MGPPHHESFYADKTAYLYMYWEDPWVLIQFGYWNSIR